MATSAENVFASDEYIQNMCDLCIEDDQRIEAKAFCTVCRQYLCEGCHKAHTRANASKDHNCLTGIEMPGDQSKSKHILRCKDHPEQVIDLFCCDHRVACCTTCKMFKHSKCGKLVSIYDLAPTINSINSKDEVKMKLTSLKSLLNEFGRLENVNEVLISELQLQKDDLIKKIRRIRKHIDEHLNNLEKEMVAEIGKDLENEVSHIRRRKDEIKCIETELRKTVKEFEAIQKTGSDHQCFVMSAVAEENLQKYTSIMDAVSNAVLPEVTLNIDSSLKNFKNQVQSFGDLVVKKSQKGIRRSYDERVPVYLTEVDMGYSTDTETPKVNAVEVMPEGGLLMCDGGNSKIKVFDSSYHFVSEVSLSSIPYSMICINPGNLIIALPLESCLQTVSLKDGKELKIKSKIKTKPNCYKLVSYGGDSMIAIAADESFVYLNLMNANGRNVRCIKKEPALGGLLSDFRDISISFDETMIYVTDQKNGCIGLSVLGEVPFVYKETGMGVYPGVCSDPDGWVYMACTDEDKVVMLSNRGQKKKDLIQHTGIRPTFMTYCPEANKLFLKRDGIGKICVFLLI